MRLFYIDGSGEGHYYTYSALGVPVEHWREVHAAVLQYRKFLKEEHGLYIRKELHATKFLSGRGRPALKHVSKQARADLFKHALTFVASMHNFNVVLFNAALGNQEWAFERLLNRINRSLQPDVLNDVGMLICDEGNEWEYVKLVRRMGVFNPIPSKYQTWRESGDPRKNIPLDRIIEDPLFKQSHRSTLIQLVDFCAYALLRQDRQLAEKNKYGIHEAFRLLEPVCFKAANKKDPLGVIR